MRNAPLTIDFGEPVLLAADDLDAAHTDAFVHLGLDALDRLGMHDGPFDAWRSITMAAHDGAVHERLRATVSRTTEQSSSRSSST
jgi:hypothetical protein